MCPDLVFAMCLAHLTSVKGFTIQLVLRELLLRINLRVLTKVFKKLSYLSFIVHS